MQPVFSDIHSVLEGFTKIISPESASFEQAAAIVERYQRSRCDVYSRYEGFRFLPVEAFKLATVACFPAEEAERVFISSGTGGQKRSRHLVRNLGIYERSVLSAYDRAVAERFGWGVGKVAVLGHLPAYAEESSLVAMVSILAEKRGSPASRLFLDDVSVLDDMCNSAAGTPVLLFGAAFGLLDLLEERSWALPQGSVVIETGGMKTHRRAIGRSELHERLARGFSVPRDQVVSEYGMCELMSQCYTDPSGLFRTPPWMRHHVLDPEDISTERPEGEEGILAFVDLANVHTVSFILTQDRAVSREGGFDVLGRMEDAELRGCNFLLESP